MVVMEALAIIIGYILGSIPSAYIAGRVIKRVDIRQLGGGNVGALNAWREIGVVAGLSVLVADMAKGAVAVLIAQWLGLSLVLVFVVGFAAVLGHMWPAFLKFKGGMGGATAMGVLFILTPVEFAIGLAVMVIVVLATSNVRLAMAIGLALLPLLIWLFGGTGSLIAYSLALPVFIALRSIPALREAFISSKRHFIVDKRFTPWQTKKKNK